MGSPTDTGSSPITKYGVYRSGAGGPSRAVVYAASDGNVQPLTGLTVGTEYTVKMLAGNAHGWASVWSPIVTATPVSGVPGVMAAPSVTAVGGGELVVLWESPTDTGSGAVTKYAVVWFWQDAADGQQYSHKVYNAAGGTEQTLTGLTVGTEYTVKIGGEFAWMGHCIVSGCDCYSCFGCAGCNRAT